MATVPAESAGAPDPEVLARSNAEDLIVGEIYPRMAYATALKDHPSSALIIPKTRRVARERALDQLERAGWRKEAGLSILPEDRERAVENEDDFDALLKAVSLLRCTAGDLSCLRTGRTEPRAESGAPASSTSLPSTSSSGLTGNRPAAPCAQDLRMECHAGSGGPRPPARGAQPFVHLPGGEVEDELSPTDIAREVNRRYGAKLRRSFDGRAASVTLRRLAAVGRIHVVREGTAHREALYSRTRPAPQ